MRIVALALLILCLSPAVMAQSSSGAPAPHTATLATLQGLSTASFTCPECGAGSAYPNGVWRDDYATGFGAPPLRYLPETGSCQANARVNDGGSCVNTSDGNSFYALFPSTIDIREFGADPSGVGDSTAAINAAFAYAPNGVIVAPCGTFSVGQLVIVGQVPFATSRLQFTGAGACTVLSQNAANLANNLLIIGGIGLINSTSDIKVANIFFTAVSAKTGGSGIFSKGAGRPQFTNLWFSNMYNGITIDGVDFAKIDHVNIFGPIGSEGILAYDGYDCGFTPVQLSTNGATATSQNVISLPSTSGLSIGMSVFSHAPNNTQPIGVIQSVASNTSVTLTTNASLPVTNGQMLTFGGECGGVGLIVTGDTTITSAGDSDISIFGGVGGVYIESAHLYTATAEGINIENALSQGIPNREIFLESGTDVDSNGSTGVFVGNASITKLIDTGAWINASWRNCAMIIGPQAAGDNPVEGGATVSLTGGVIGQSGGCGLTWADSGTLTISGVDISYSFPASSTAGDVSGSGIVISSGSGAGQVTIVGNKIRSNGGYGIRLIGLPPADMLVNDNIITNNASASTNLTPTSTLMCGGNLGGTNGC